MRTRFPQAPLVAFTLAAMAVLVSGCVAPSDSDTCYAPPPEGLVDYILATQNGTARDVPPTDETRWVVMVTCAGAFRELGTLTIVVETVAHGRLVAEVDVRLPNDGTLTLYAPAADGGANATSVFAEDLPDEGRGAAYRLRISDDSRSREGLDERDLLELRYDAEGRRDFRSELPVGTYTLLIRDRAGDELLGSVSHRVFDASIGRPGQTATVAE